MFNCAIVLFMTTNPCQKTTEPYPIPSTESNAPSLPGEADGRRLWKNKVPLGPTYWMMRPSRIAGTSSAEDLTCVKDLPPQAGYETDPGEHSTPLPRARRHSPLPVFRQRLFLRVLPDWRHGVAPLATLKNRCVSIPDPERLAPQCAPSDRLRLGRPSPFQPCPGSSMDCKAAATSPLRSRPGRGMDATEDGLSHQVVEHNLL